MKRNAKFRSGHGSQMAGQSGFSLIELIVAMAILLVLSGAVMSLIVNMTATQQRVNKRTITHSSVRSATALLQQEITQAGRFTFRPSIMPVTLQGNTAATGASQTVALSSAADVFFNGNYINNTIGGTRLIVDTGANTELVYVTAVSGNNITAAFDKSHASGALVRPAGAFGFGIIPTTYTVSGTNVGSNGFILKLLGDINDDGEMVLVVYRCELDPDGSGTNDGNGNLTRQEIPYDLATPANAANPAIYPHEVLLTGLDENPDGPDAGTAADPCFDYQEEVTSAGPQAFTFVTNVAVTLTVRTASVNIKSNEDEKLKKALLNVSPRNVFEAYRMTQNNPLAYTSHVQFNPPSIDQILGYTN